MNSDYHFEIDKTQLKAFISVAEYDKAFDILTTPLHEWLYEKQDFEALDSRSVLEQLILGYDYIKMQVEQGGFRLSTGSCSKKICEVLIPRISLICIDRASDDSRFYCRAERSKSVTKTDGIVKV